MDSILLIHRKKHNSYIYNQMNDYFVYIAVLRLHTLSQGKTISKVDFSDITTKTLLLQFRDQLKHTHCSEQSNNKKDIRERR
jgi:hypothetical protein